MLMIEMLIVIACSSLAIALFYSYYKIGRHSAYDDLLKHFEDAVKLLNKQDAIIQAYEQKFKEIEKEAQQ